ncbi:hypothetical protein LSCM1_06294 [Leishmania martiniquensis]|uniref:Uncharacterized protein n=1 Tax=Leishmania martiniquensis TaxID=1580590 RepID=A0A836KS07_9TRYP|nr:hypothetical protein LSCM1_06294 [Leishmania martiniquensis]
MELQTQTQFFSLPPRPYTASLVWACLACGQLAPYQGAPYDSIYNVDGFGSPLQSTPSTVNATPGKRSAAYTTLDDRDGTAHAHSSPPSKTTQHRHGYLQYSPGEHTCHASRENLSSPRSGGVAVPAAIAAPVLSSSPVTSSPLREESLHSCVNDASDSYLSQAASSSHRRCGQPQFPLSAIPHIAGTISEGRVPPDSVRSTRQRQWWREDAAAFTEVSNPQASEAAFGDGKAAVDNGISSSCRRRASTTVTVPVTPPLFTSLGNIGNSRSSLELSPRAPSVASLPQFSPASPLLWRHADVHGVHRPLSAEACSTQEGDAMHSLTVLLMEEHLIGSREMRFCDCCGEVRCAEIRKATEPLPPSLPARAADDISYGDEAGDDDMTRAAQGAVAPQPEAWSVPLSLGCSNVVGGPGERAEVVHGPPPSHSPSRGNEPELLEAWLGNNCRTSERATTAPLDGSDSAAEIGSQASMTAQRRSPSPRAPLPDLHQQAQAKAREAAPSVRRVAAFSLARLLSKVKCTVVAAVHSLNPLSLALLHVYPSSGGGDNKGGTVEGNDRSTVFGRDSAQLQGSSASCVSPPSQDGWHPRYQHNTCEREEMKGGRWTTASASTETSRATPSMSVSAERTTPCWATPLSLAGGGPVEDLNSASVDSSGPPSWAFTAPDEEEVCRVEDSDEGLVIQHLLGSAQGDEDAGRGGAEGACSRPRRFDDGYALTPAAKGTAAAAETTGMMRAWKDKWNSISISEALWRLVLPSFSSPFLTMMSMPSTASADRVLSLGSKRPIGCLMDWIASSPRRGVLESTVSSAVAAGARPYRGFRGDVEEAIRQLDAEQLEVAKLRLQQVLAAVNAERARREREPMDAYAA